MTERIEESFERSVDLLSRAATTHGFVASPSFDHYAAIWGRDASIACLGALATGRPDLVRTAAATLDTLSAHASPLGQIPAVMIPARGEWDFGEGGVVDTTAWFVIAVGRYLGVTGDAERTRTWWPAVQNAITWLGYQDVTGSGLVSAAPSTDWMDAALTRSGRTLHLNALYVWAVRSGEQIACELGEAWTVGGDELADRFDAWFWPRRDLDPATLYPHGFAHDATRIGYWEAATPARTHYLSHIVHAAFVETCDVLANLMAVAAGIPDAGRAALILESLEPSADPFPTRTFPQPIGIGDGSGMLISTAEASIPHRWRNRPGAYHNGAAWPYIGGFHAEAAARHLGRDAATALLDRVAAANALGDWSFPEWIDADGLPAGASHQTWNAATFVLGFRALGEV
ncbi:MAG TPA: amylo-alpha-1,6-glucosidase [Acidimicrobiia bacterium]|nr:amylo-alpha-1,6-glucosidase [Acidimicrobiia bacterium]